jgi:hypothetical protein
MHIHIYKNTISNGAYTKIQSIVINLVKIKKEFKYVVKLQFGFTDSLCLAN